jgi:HlyD family secretion protein
LAELGVDTQVALQQVETDLQSARTAYAQAESQMGNALRSARQELEEARATERQIRERTLPGGDATELTMAREARQAAQQEVDRLQAELNTQLLPYLQSVEAAEQNLKRARLDAKLSTVDAPISGTVTRLMVQPGANVTAPNTQIAEIVRLDDLLLIAEVQPNQHKIVEDSDHVYIRFNEFPDKVFDGHVASVQALPSKEGNRVTHEAKIDFTNDEGMVKPNMTIRSVGIVLGRAEDVVAVPVGAIARDEAGKAFVMVKNGAEWVRTPVELGLSDGDYVEVKSGLKKDEVVQVVPNRNEVGPTAETLDS